MKDKILLVFVGVPLSALMIVLLAFVTLPYFLWWSFEAAMGPKMPPQKRNPW